MATSYNESGDLTNNRDGLQNRFANAGCRTSVLLVKLSGWRLGAFFLPRFRGQFFKSLHLDHDLPSSALSCDITIGINFGGREQVIPFIDAEQFFAKPR
jgi:hypothetical protein